MTWHVLSIDPGVVNLGWSFSRVVVAGVEAGVEVIAWGVEQVCSSRDPNWKLELGIRKLVNVVLDRFWRGADYILIEGQYQEYVKPFMYTSFRNQLTEYMMRVLCPLDKLIVCHPSSVKRYYSVAMGDYSLNKAEADKIVGRWICEDWGSLRANQRNHVSDTLLQLCHWLETSKKLSVKRLDGPSVYAHRSAEEKLHPREQRHSFETSASSSDGREDERH